MAGAIRTLQEVGALTAAEELTPLGERGLPLRGEAAGMQGSSYACSLESVMSQQVVVFCTPPPRPALQATTWLHCRWTLALASSCCWPPRWAAWPPPSPLRPASGEDSARLLRRQLADRYGLITGLLAPAITIAACLKWGNLVSMGSHLLNGQCKPAV